MKGRSRHPYLDSRSPIALAHRGGAVEGLENSMTAFADAVSLGYRYLETDVHATADGVLIAFHDEHLDRVTDARGAVAGLPWSAVSRARIGGREPIPRLEELLAAWPQARINIDVKSDQALAPLITLLLHRRDLLDRICVGSFSQARLRRVRRALGPGLCTSAGPREVTATWLASRVGTWAARCLHVAADCYQVPPTRGPLRVVDARFLAAAHAQGRPVHVWTINDRDEMEGILDLGVDGLVSDATRTLREVLRARGLWDQAPLSS